MTGSDKPKRAGVMGWPIGHSLSPRIHDFWLTELNIDGTYEPLAVAPENLAQELRALPEKGFAGVNLTIPHKEAAMAILDNVDDLAKRIGAVNTVEVAGDGSLAGTNTDAFGFIENVSAGAPEWRGDGGAAVVLGAGGAARAVVCALLDEGAPEIRLVNRTRANAEKLAQDIGGPIQVIGWAGRSEALGGAKILVNTTSLGMTGQPPLEIVLNDLPNDAVVNDIVYAPLETALLKGARARGNIGVDGLGMLLHQARRGFAIWFGGDPKVTPELRAHVLAHVLAGPDT
ncbi:MAG: shikimate dehydrogenase [Rhodospirillales bacterium]|nr:shikimate dehydrogenase [Rhodospirillales bacterium]